MGLVAAACALAKCTMATSLTPGAKPRGFQQAVAWARRHAWLRLTAVTTLHFTSGGSCSRWKILLDGSTSPVLIKKGKSVSVLVLVLIVPCLSTFSEFRLAVEQIVLLS